MKPFAYTRVADQRGAILALAEDPGARLIAGGTNLLDLMKLGVEAPERVVDINGLGLDEIVEGTDGLRIGALARMSDVAAAPVVREEYPLVAEALLAGASPQLRNMATIGGNLLQRTRCGYFRDVAFPCNKRAPGAGCAAIGGDDRRHAVLGTSDACIATYPGDLAVALSALDAVVHVRGTGGERRVPIDDFYLEPGPTPDREHDLRPDELIVSVELRKPPAGARSRYVKVRDRASFEFALTSAAVVLTVEDGAVRHAGIALGGVGTKPWRARGAEDVLRGGPLSEARCREAAEAALAGARPGRHNGFKVELAKRTLVRALLTAGDGA